MHTTDLLDFAVARSAMTGLNLDRMGGSVASFDNLYLPRLHRQGYVAPNASASRPPAQAVLCWTRSRVSTTTCWCWTSRVCTPALFALSASIPWAWRWAYRGELPQEQTCPGFLDAQFAREGHILPQLIAQLWQQRDEAKAACDEPLSQAIKIIMNSFYGVLGTPGCRFFDARLASSITRRGHQILSAPGITLRRRGIG